MTGFTVIEYLLRVFSTAQDQMQKSMSIILSIGASTNLDKTIF